MRSTRWTRARDRLVAFVGKLIVSKGVDLLLAAWPLVLARVPDARLVVVGFGAYREGFERLRAALADGDLERAKQIARAGRALEGEAGDAQPLRHLLAFLDGLAGDRLARYLAAARSLGDSVVLTGRLDHEELADLLPACEAMVVPSTFPEAFGMVAAEAAACGVLPVSAAHSGLAEVSDALARAVPAEIAPARCPSRSTTAPSRRWRRASSAGCRPSRGAREPRARGWSRRCASGGRGRASRAA